MSCVFLLVGQQESWIWIFNTIGPLLNGTIKVFYPKENLRKELEDRLHEKLRSSAVRVMGVDKAAIHSFAFPGQYAYLMFFVFIVLFFFFWDRVSLHNLCSPQCPGICFVDCTGLKLRDFFFFFFAPRVLGLKTLSHHVWLIIKLKYSTK